MLESSFNEQIVFVRKCLSKAKWLLYNDFSVILKDTTKIMCADHLFQEFSRDLQTVFAF